MAISTKNAVISEIYALEPVGNILFFTEFFKFIEQV